MMRLRDAIRNIMTRKKDSEIKTRYPLPFKVSMKVMYKNTNRDENAILEDKGYTVSAFDTYKRYRWSKYPKRVLEEFLDDYTGDFPSWSNGEVQVALDPTNISQQEHRDERFLRSIFYSINAVVPFLAPFWIRRWKLPHNDLNRMVVQNVGEDLQDVMDSTVEHVVNLYESNNYGYLITLNRFYNHPSMVLSGVSILQSIMARAFYNNHLRGVSQIFVSGERCDSLWNKIHTTDELIDSMYKDINMCWGSHPLPGLEHESYENLKQGFVDILREYTRNTGSFKDRCSKLSLSFWRDGNTEHRPVNNEAALYNVLEDEFSWSRGPEVR